MSKVEEIHDEKVETKEPKETKEDKVEAVHQHDENCDSDDVADADGSNQPVPGGAKPNRGEKKCRKAMQKLGLKPVPGINRVTMKRAKNMLFIVENPEVLKSPNADIYVVLGVEDLSQIAANKEIEQFKAEQPKKDEPKIETIKEEAEDEDDTDETGLNAEDINNVIEHSKATRAQAIKTLKECNGDTVEAILKLS